MALLNLADGGRLSYESVGSGRPIVLLHGWGMRAGYFEAQAAALSSRYRIVAPDLRGHGGSSPLERDQGLPTLVGDVAELLRRLDLRDTLVVGWSMGAMVSWGLMERAEAGRVSALATIDMVPRLLNGDGWTFGLRDGTDAGVFSDVVQRMQTDWPAFTQVFVPRIVARGRLAERAALVERLIADAQDNDPVSMARLWLSMANQNFRERLTALDIPCLVAYGARSQLYSEEASRWLAGRLPNARSVRFEDSGHAPHLEEPEKFNRELAAFAEETSTAGRSIPERSGAKTPAEETPAANAPSAASTTRH